MSSLARLRTELGSKTEVDARLAQQSLFFLLQFGATCVHRANECARSRSPDEAAKITSARVAGPRTGFYRIRTAFSRITFPPALNSIRYTPVGSSRPASSCPSQRRE